MYIDLSLMKTFMLSSWKGKIVRISTKEAREININGPLRERNCLKMSKLRERVRHEDRAEDLFNLSMRASSEGVTG